MTDGFVEDLRNIVGKANISTADAVRDLHGHDESYHPSVFCFVFFVFSCCLFIDSLIMIRLVSVFKLRLQLKC